MKVLKHQDIDKEFVFDETANYYLCIENPKFLCEFIRSITTDIESDNQKLLLYENGKLQKLSKQIFYIPNPMDITLDEKKLNTVIQKDIASSIDSNENEQYLTLVNQINNYLDSIRYDYDLPITYNSDRDLPSLLKAVSVSYKFENSDLLSALSEHIKILSSIFKFQIFIIMNLTDYLTQKELSLFLKESRELEVSVLLLSSHLPTYEFDGKSVIRIDSDLCELHIDSNNEKD